MKNYFITAGVLLLMLAGISSCKEKTCPCLNGGTCQADHCECPAGYSGETCETLSRSKVIASYNTDLNNAGGTGNCLDSIYIITIDSSSLGPEYVVIRNLDGRGTDVFATVAEHTDKYYITIPQQVSGVSTFFGDFQIQKPGLTGTFNWNSYGGCSGTVTRRP